MTNERSRDLDRLPLDFVGVDMTEATFEWALHGAGVSHSERNDEMGFNALLEVLKGRRIGLIVIEATGGLQRALAGFLVRQNLPVAMVNPRAAREFARSMGRLAKTDAIDAAALAHYAQTLNAKADQAGVKFMPPAAEVEALQAIVTRRAQLVSMRKAENNRLGGAVRVLDKSIRAVLKTLDKEIAKLDRDIDAQLEQHFKEQVQRFEKIKGVGTHTCAVLLAFMPELGTLSNARAAKLAGLAPLTKTPANTAVGGTFGVADASYAVRCIWRCSARSASTPSSRLFMCALCEPGSPGSSH